MARSDAILERLLRLHPKKIDLSLGRVLALLDRLGRPQDRLAPVIHVAGTNGKGSTVAFLRAMLEAAGYRVHVYTSPHLVRFHERIRLAGKLIAEDDLAALLEECERVNGGDPITYFEITTAAAFKAFAETPADIVLLEVGLGGRYDATTVIERPAATAITPISMDHMQFLGDTLAEIAGEKAAIQKSGIVSAIGPQHPVALAVIEAAARGCGAPLVRFGTEWRTEMRPDALRYEAGDTVRDLPLPALPGPHQGANAGLAIACLDRLDGFEVPEAAIAEGLRTVEWPARIQRLVSGNLAALLPVGWELWLDGGHNAAAGEMLAAVAAGWRDRPLHLVFGMLDSKAPEDFLRPLAPDVASVRTVGIPGEEASLTAEDCAAAARAAGIGAVETASGVADALRAIARAEDRPSRVLVCGSLYLAGHVLAENGG